MLYCSVYHCHGYRFERTFVDPMCHSVWYGVGRNWLELICNTTNGIEVDGKPVCLGTQLQERADLIIHRTRLPSAYGRPPCLLRGYASTVLCGVEIQSPQSLWLSWVVCRHVGISRWLFEEMATFVEITGAAMFWYIRDDPGMHPLIVEMWSHFRCYALYFMQYRAGQHTTHQIRAAQAHLYRFAWLAEVHLQGKLLTLLLHRAVVHIPEQVMYGLPGAFLGEAWGERCVRRVKGRITGASTKETARASATVCLTEMALRELAVQNPGIAKGVIAATQKQSRQEADPGDEYGSSLRYLRNAYTGDTDDEVRSLITRGLLGSDAKS